MMPFLALACRSRQRDSPLTSSASARALDAISPVAFFSLRLLSVHRLFRPYLRPHSRIPATLLSAFSPLCAVPQQVFGERPSRCITWGSFHNMWRSCSSQYSVLNLFPRRIAWAVHVKLIMSKNFLLFQTPFSRPCTPPHSGRCPTS